MFTTLCAFFVLFHLGNVIVCDVSPDLRSAITNYYSVTAAAVRTPQPAKFVDKLKDNLRRNNDDYIELRNKSVASVTPSPTSTIETTASGKDGDAYLDQVNDVYRRMMHDRRDRHDRHDRRDRRDRHDRRERHDRRDRHHRHNARRTRHRHVQRRSDVALGTNKFKLTEDKISTKKPDSKDMYDRERRVPYVSAGKRLYQFRVAAAAALAADRAARARPDDGEDDQAHLDMVPAKGHKVNKLRDKKHLCNRHVLIPEGPKYDSAGAVYLRAHPEDAARAFAHTAAPALLLPRCCNCCKKSVLGCE